MEEILWNLFFCQTSDYSGLVIKLCYSTESIQPSYSYIIFWTYNILQFSTTNVDFLIRNVMSVYHPWWPWYCHGCWGWCKYLRCRCRGRSCWYYPGGTSNMTVETTLLNSIIHYYKRSVESQNHKTHSLLPPSHKTGLHCGSTTLPSINPVNKHSIPQHTHI